MKKKILLITTKGCEACQVMNNIIERAIYLYGKEVKYEIKDKDEVGIKFLKDKEINDFPTTVFYQNDNIVFITTGTKPSEVLKKEMVIHFD